MSYYYLYDGNSVITQQVDSPPADGSAYCISDQQFDLDLNYVIVGSVDSDHNLIYPQVKAKPAEQLAAALKVAQDQIAAQQSQISAANDAIAELSILIAGGAT